MISEGKVGKLDEEDWWEGKGKGIFLIMPNISSFLTLKAFQFYCIDTNGYVEESMQSDE